MSASVGAIVVAAGSGERFGAGMPKALVLLSGRPLVAWAVEAVAEAGVDQIVVTAPAGHVADFVAALRDVPRVRPVVVVGGATRAASVRRGLDALQPRPEVVLVHDAARAGMPATVIRSTAEAIGQDVLAAAPGLPLVDTLKRVGADGSIRSTVDRNGVWAVQTPQAFTSDVLLAIHAWAGEREATDDLGLFEAAVAAGAISGRAVMVSGHRDGRKITFPYDLRLAEAALRADREQRS